MTTEHEAPAPGEVSDDDPSAPLRPLCDEQRFGELLEIMVAQNAPRIFAVVEELGERANGRIAAWGMAFEDHADAVTLDGRMRMRLPCADDALTGFDWDEDITARLVWLEPTAALTEST